MESVWFFIPKAGIAFIVISVLLMAFWIKYGDYLFLSLFWILVSEALLFTICFMLTDEETKRKMKK